MFGNINRQELSTAKGCQHQGPNRQRQPTISQNPPSSLISPLPRHRNLQEGLHIGICFPLSVWNYHHTTSVSVPKRHTVNPHPSNLHPYHLHPSITSDKNIFCAFTDVVKNSSPLWTWASKYKVHSSNTMNILYEYESHNIYITRQENKPIVDTNNQNQITRWAQELLDMNHSNHLYTNWELMTACQIRVLSNASYDQLKSDYVITKSTLKRYLVKICRPIQWRNVQYVHKIFKRGEVSISKVIEIIKMSVQKIKVRIPTYLN